MRQRLYLRPGWSWLSRGDKMCSLWWDCWGLAEAVSAYLYRDHAPHHYPYQGWRWGSEMWGNNLGIWVKPGPPPTLPESLPAGPRDILCNRTPGVLTPCAQDSQHLLASVRMHNRNAHRDQSLSLIFHSWISTLSLPITTGKQIAECSVVSLDLRVKS